MVYRYARGLSLFIAMPGDFFFSRYVFFGRVAGNSACEPNDVMVKLLFTHSIPGHSRPMGRPHLTWMDTAMHDMGSLRHTLQLDARPSTRLGEPSPVPGCVEGGVQPVLSCEHSEQCFVLFQVFLSFLRLLFGA